MTSPTATLPIDIGSLRPAVRRNVDQYPPPSSRTSWTATRPAPTTPYPSAPTHSATTTSGVSTCRPSVTTIVLANAAPAAVARVSTPTSYTISQGGGGASRTYWIARARPTPT